MSKYNLGVLIETGIKGGIGVFIATSILALLIIPSKTAVLFYALFFGNYPIIKSLAEQAKTRTVEWIIKLIIANAELAVFLLFFKELFFEFINFSNNYKGKTIRIDLKITEDGPFSKFDSIYIKDH